MRRRELVVLDLSADEALVLFEFLSRYGESERLETVDQAEQRALLRLCGKLESRLVEPFAPNYAELLAAARERVRGSA
jgi:hypothetical protein